MVSTQVLSRWRKENKYTFLCLLFFSLILLKNIKLNLNTIWNLNITYHNTLEIMKDGYALLATHTCMISLKNKNLSGYFILRHYNRTYQNDWRTSQPKYSKQWVCMNWSQIWTISFNMLYKLLKIYYERRNMYNSTEIFRLVQLFLNRYVMWLAVNWKASSKRSFGASLKEVSEQKVGDPALEFFFLPS